MDHSSADRRRTDVGTGGARRRRPGKQPLFVSARAAAPAYRTDIFTPREKASAAEELA